MRFITAAVSRPIQFIRDLASKDALLLVAMLVIVGGTLMFVELFDQVQEGDTDSLDRLIMEFAGRHRGPVWLQEAGRDITALGATSVLTLATLSVVGFLALQRQYRAILLVVAATLGGYLISSNIKTLVGRERPQIFEHGDVVSTMSFPSGHALMSAVVYLTLGSLLVSLVKEHKLKVYILTTAAMLTFLIGVSRIYIGVHWPTDVLAGWTAGLVWALLCTFVERHLQRRGVVEKEKAASK